MPCNTAAGPTCHGAAEHRHMKLFKLPCCRVMRDGGRLSQAAGASEVASTMKAKRPPVCDGGGNRKLPPPPSKYAMLPYCEFERLKAASNVITAKEQLDMQLQQVQEALEQEEEAEKLRLHFVQIDNARRHTDDTASGNEDELNAMKLKEHAFLVKQEREEEVKLANRIILDAKCNAVREAQIQERNALQRQKREQEQRLDKVVVDRAIEEINKEDQKADVTREVKMKYAQDVKVQISERETLRMLEAERSAEEAKRARKVAEAIKKDEERQLVLKHERKENFKADLQKMIEMTNTFKKMLYENEMESEMKVRAYMKDREERELALRAAKKVAKSDAERRQQVLFTMAQKIFDAASKRQESGYLRQYEQMERAYRQKEKEDALRRTKNEQDLHESRNQQLRDMKNRRALQMARSEEDYKSLLAKLAAEETKEQEAKRVRKQQQSDYRQVIMKQMADKVFAHRRQQEMYLNEAFELRENERQRCINIRAVLDSKVDDMKAAALPDRYIKEVEKQLLKLQSLQLCAKK